MRRVGIDAINLGRLEVVTDGGEIVPIVTLLDCKGDETDDSDEAAAFVAGPNCDGLWFADLVESYGGRRN